MLGKYYFIIIVIYLFTIIVNSDTEYVVKVYYYCYQIEDEQYNNFVFVLNNMGR